MMIMTISTTKKQKWPKIIFLGTIINEILASGRGMVRGKMLHFVAFFVHFDKLIRPHPGPLWEGGSAAWEFFPHNPVFLWESFPNCHRHLDVTTKKLLKWLTHKDDFAFVRFHGFAYVWGSRFCNPIQMR